MRVDKLFQHHSGQLPQRNGRALFNQQSGKGSRKVRCTGRPVQRLFCGSPLAGVKTLCRLKQPSNPTNATGFDLRAFLTLSTLARPRLAD
jgi:hypothetical protein